MRYYALDIVRFFSALAVVLYHYVPRGEAPNITLLARFTEFGYLGVPIFFIVSGFVIALSAEGRSPGKFVISRLVRLYPSYWAGIAFTVIVVLITGSGHYGLTRILANLTMLNDYFNIQNLDDVYWTLQVELKFYGCVYLLLLLGIFQKFRIWLSFWTLAAIAFVILGDVPFMGWFINPGYSCYFIAGVGFFLIGKEGPNLYNGAVVLVAMVLSAIMAFRQTSEFIPEPEHWERSVSSGLVVLSFAFFALLALGRLNIQKSGAFVVLGGMTYPLYLIHARAGKAIIDQLGSRVSEWVSVVLVILLMLLFSYLIHVFVEKKISPHLKKVLTEFAGKWKLV